VLVAQHPGQQPHGLDRWFVAVLTAEIEFHDAVHR
jgi:hypothetical protein